MRDDEKFISKEDLDNIIKKSIIEFFESKKNKKDKRDYQKEILEILDNNDGEMDSLELKKQMKCSDTSFYLHFNQLIEEGKIMKEINGRKKTVKRIVKDFTIGDWTFKKSNNTLNFYSKDENGKRKYWYEIDLDKGFDSKRFKSLSDSWISHLVEKSSDNISDDDLRDLSKCFIKLGYVVDLDKMERDICRFDRK